MTPLIQIYCNSNKWELVLKLNTIKILNQWLNETQSLMSYKLCIDFVIEVKRHSNSNYSLILTFSDW
jgi:hypothetical protein